MTIKEIILELSKMPDNEEIETNVTINKVSFQPELNITIPLRLSTTQLK